MAKVGVNFFIAAEATARAAPDGYTIGLGSGVLSSINPNLFKSLPYDPDRDFEHIGMMVDTVWIMIAAHASVPANNFAEFVQLAKKNPGKYSYQITVALNGMYMRWLSKKLGISLLEVEYKSTPTAVQDALSGRTDLIVNSINAYEPHIKAAMDNVVRNPEFAKRLLALGWANREGARSPRAITDHALAERARWAEIARDAGVTPQ